MSDYTDAEFTRYAALHKELNGPGDARPTAIQIVKDNNLEGSLVVNPNIHIISKTPCRHAH